MNFLQLNTIITREVVGIGGGNGIVLMLLKTSCLCKAKL